MATCTFCEALSKHIDNAEFYAKPRPGRTETTRTELSASFISDTYYGEHYCGRQYVNSFPLRFCPECGKPIEKTIIKTPESE